MATSPPPSDVKSFNDSYGPADHLIAPNGPNDPSFSPSSTTWLKVDLVVLPVISIMYFLSSLVRSASERLSGSPSLTVLTWVYISGSSRLIKDRTNIGNARIAGLQQQLHISDDQVNHHDSRNVSVVSDLCIGPLV